MNAVLNEWSTGVIAVVVAIPVAVLLLEVLASLGGRRSRGAFATSRPRAAVLIPAHDEEAGIATTLRSVMRATGPDDRVLVVADNCTDGTAEVARRLGAEVVERHDTRRRGKGYAIEFGVEHLTDGSGSPDVLVVIDADCEIDAEGIGRLAARAEATGRPVQALNLAEEDPDPGPLQAVSTLSFRFKNLVRTLGASRLGWPCHLMGTGMALPWPLVERASFGGDNLVEDMQLGIDLAVDGHEALFEPAARVTSPLPTKDSAFVSQRTRWEHGHVRTAVRNVPRLLATGVRRARLGLIGLGLDLCIPPLSLLVMGWLIATAVTISGWLFGGSTWPLIVSLSTGGTLSLAVLIGWAAHCRTSVPLRTFVLVPWFLLRKLPIYASLPFRRGAWVRTERDVVRTTSKNSLEEQTGGAA